jgi:hypothetical protein
VADNTRVGGIVFKFHFSNGGCTFHSNSLRIKTKVYSRIYIQFAPSLVYEAENNYANILLLERFVRTLQQNKNISAFKVNVHLDRCTTPYVMLDSYDVNL